MSVHITMKRRRRTMKILEADSAASSVSTREENFLVEIEPAASSTLSQGSSTAVNKLVEEMALVCCIVNVKFRNFVEEHELGATEGINVKVYFTLVDHL